MGPEVCPNCRGVVGQEFSSSIPTSMPCKCGLTTYSSCRCQKFQCISVNHSSKYFRSHPFSDSGPKTVFRLFLWILLIFPLSTMSNPLPMKDEEAGPSSGHKSKRIHDHPMKWINPCRIPSSIPALPSDLGIEIITQSDAEIVQNIITQVNKAEHQAKKFIYNYYRETFGEDLNVRDKFSDVHYDFLKDINDLVSKRLGEKLSHEELDKLNLVDTLRSMYSGLQMFAVGIEQIVLDQSVYAGNFHKDFSETEYQLKFLLCEIQIGLLEKSIQHEDVLRSIMSGDYRDIDADTIRNIRDWVIFRDYVNLLEYIHQSFRHFLAKIEGES